MEINVSKKFSGFGKPLPRSAENGLLENHFEAFGKKFYILTKDDLFPISRWGYFRKFAFQFMSSSDFTNAFTAWDKHLRLCNQFAVNKSNSGVTFTDLILNCEANKSAIKALSEMRYDMSLYLCTLFIVSEGEEISSWSTGIAEEKIECWIKEGYAIDDFFLIAIHFINTYIEKSLTILSDGLSSMMKTTTEPTENIELPPT